MAKNFFFWGEIVANALLMHHCIYKRIKRITFSTVRENHIKAASDIKIQAFSPILGRFQILKWRHRVFSHKIRIMCVIFHRILLKYFVRTIMREFSAVFETIFSYFWDNLSIFCQVLGQFLEKFWTFMS